MFNTLKYAKKLESAGVARKHAEQYVLVIHEIMDNQMATKKDISTLAEEISSVRQEVADVRQEVADLREDTKQEFVKVRKEMSDLYKATQKDLAEAVANLRTEIANMANKLIITLGSMSVATIGIVVTVVKYLP